MAWTPLCQAASVCTENGAGIDLHLHGSSTVETVEQACGDLCCAVLASTVSAAGDMTLRSECSMGRKFSICMCFLLHMVLGLLLLLLFATISHRLVAVVAELNLQSVCLLMS